MVLREFAEKGLIDPPKWAVDNLVYLARMGSAAYGVVNETSDIDHHGIVVPPKAVVFPTVRGEIPGFGRPAEPFLSWDRHNVVVRQTVHDFSLWGIVHFFDLLHACNPRMIDMLFVHDDLVQHCTKVGRMIRDRRRMFLTRRVHKSFVGSAAANRGKLVNKKMTRYVVLCQKAGIDPLTTTLAGVNAMMEPGGTSAAVPKLCRNEVGELVGLLREAEKEGGWSDRLPLVTRYGYDVRFAYHLVRCLLECEQIVLTGDLDLLRNVDVLMAIRAGEWTVERILAFYDAKVAELDEARGRFVVPETGDERAVRSLLWSCLEEHYGSLGTLHHLKDAA